VNNIPTLWAIVIALVVAIVGTAGVTSLLTVRAVNRKTLAGARLDEENADKADAEARKVVAEASAFLIDPLTKRAKALEQELATASAELASLRNQMSEMAKELTELRDENQRLKDGKR
jgi:uncharacterized membrane-anchored protein YhcB (DUF1043 family)